MTCVFWVKRKLREINAEARYVLESTGRTPITVIVSPSENPSEYVLHET
jgi:hypothetical protein